MWVVRSASRLLSFRPGRGEPKSLLMKALPKTLVVAIALAVLACGSDSPTATVVDTTTSTSTTSTSTSITTFSTSTNTSAPATTTVTSVTTVSSSVSKETAEVAFDVSVFDWTESVPPGDVHIVVGDETWQPDMEFGGDVRSFGDFEVGTPATVMVYPDGLGSRAIEVTFVMTEEMAPKSGSAETQTHVEIYDDEVQVWGLAIPDFEQFFDR